MPCASSGNTKSLEIPNSATEQNMPSETTPRSLPFLISVPSAKQDEGLFSLENSRALREIFEEQGWELTDELIIRREILQNGRSVSRINGKMVNLSVLKAVGQHLVDIHGQHDQEELMRPQLHIAMLDEFGSADFLNLKGRYQETFDRYRSLRS